MKGSHPPTSMCLCSVNLPQKLLTWARDVQMLESLREHHAFEASVQGMSLEIGGGFAQKSSTW